MKMLALVIILMSISWTSHAKGWGHFNHDNQYQRRHDKLSFLQDVEMRQYKQHIYIDRGIERGQLTHSEVRELEREKKHVDKQIKHFKRHQYINHADKNSIARHLDHYSDQIRHLKHNNRYVNRGHHYHNAFSHRKSNKNYYRNDHRLSSSNNNYSAGFYFRF